MPACSSLEPFCRDFRSDAQAGPLTGDNLPSNVSKKGDMLRMASTIKLFNLPKDENHKFLADIGLTAEQVNRFERRVFLAVRAKQTPKPKLRTTSQTKSWEVHGTFPDHILDFGEYTISLTNYLKAQTGLSEINPAAIFRLGLINAARYPDVVKKIHADVSSQDEQSLEFADGRCKNTPELVREIRRVCDAEPNLSIRQLGNRFSIPPSTVSDIISRRTWRNLS